MAQLSQQDEEIFRGEACKSENRSRVVYESIFNKPVLSEA
ncbi:MAG: hypothetical protein EWM72_03345 [Nitrospira sp.]|nr:MAG: hypothetical protein EWM72_03345 [Nitrospira sp.]